MGCGVILQERKRKKDDRWKGPWVSVSFRINGGKRCVSHWAPIVTHVIFMHRFCSDTVRDHAELPSFESVLNTPVSPCFLSRGAPPAGPLSQLVPTTWEVSTAESTELPAV